MSEMFGEYQDGYGPETPFYDDPGAAGYADPYAGLDEAAGYADPAAVAAYEDGVAEYSEGNMYAGWGDSDSETGDWYEQQAVQDQEAADFDSTLTGDAPDYGMAIGDEENAADYYGEAAGEYGTAADDYGAAATDFGDAGSYDSSDY